MKYDKSKRAPIFAAISTAFLFPLAAFALEFGTYQAAVNSIRTLIDVAFGVLLSIAVFIVAFGIFKFIAQAANEQARAQGRAYILWGIVGIFIMLSIWGLVNLLATTIHLNSEPGNIPSILPNLPDGSSSQSSQSQQCYDACLSYNFTPAQCQVQCGP